MAATKTVWGIDIGQCALKAVKLQRAGDNYKVETCEIIEHSNVLSQPDVDSRAIVRASLDEFLQRHDVTESMVSVSVLGQSSFMRFVKLPPVEKRKIPEIVRFEAEQQIPFPINEMTWRYQTFEDPDSPEIEAGIFAMKNADIHDMLSYFAPAGLEVDVVQMAPLALYNFLKADKQYVDSGATLLCDVGADKTHLVISDGDRVWTRTINIGGNNFTHALCKSFNLNFEKAEKLKRTASASKYARQIFQVMRPVFAQLVQEIQRSIGYYTSINRDCRFKKLLGVGCGFLLPGMQKYLEQNLNIKVEQISAFNNVETDDPNFQSRSLSFGVAFGLAVQGLGDGEIDCNLLPEDILRKRLWGKKTPWFAAAAAAIIVAAGMYTLRGFADFRTLNSQRSIQQLNAAQATLAKLDGWEKESKKIDTNLEEHKATIAENLKLRAYSKAWPAINSHIAAALEQTVMDPNDARILEAFAMGKVADPMASAGQLRSDQAMLELLSLLPVNPENKPADPTLRDKIVAKLNSRDRQSLELMLLESMESTYSTNLKATTAAAGNKNVGGMAGPMMMPGMDRPKRRSKKREEKKVDLPRGFDIKLRVRTPASQQKAAALAQKFKTALQSRFEADPTMELADGLVEVDYVTAETAGRTAGRLGGARRGLGGLGGPMPPMGGAVAMPAGRAAEETTEEQQISTYVCEPNATDVTIEFTIKAAIKSDGLPKPEVPEEEEGSRRTRRRPRVN